MGIWYEFITQYGYITVFSILSIGIIGLPIPIPDELMLAYFGYITSIGHVDFLLAFIFALIGSICGVTISYLIGMKLGKPFIHKYGSKFWLKASTFNRLEKQFQKYGPAAIFFSYFIPGCRNIVACMSGATKFSFRQFALYAYSGSFLWVMTLLFIGNRFGANVDLIAHFMHRYMWNMIILLVIAAGSYAVYYFYTRVIKDRL